MPKRTLHVMVIDDGETLDFHWAVVVKIGQEEVPTVAGQFQQLSLPKEDQKIWAKDTLVALIEHL
ncbi:MAG TPA: hypothetical protein VLV83_26220 [Acidobacteriota bacterium]|nr:hypothetical protein [Acidobacteriota bacterium]